MESFVYRYIMYVQDTIISQRSLVHVVYGILSHTISTLIVDTTDSITIYHSPPTVYITGPSMPQPPKNVLYGTPHPPIEVTTALQPHPLPNHPTYLRRPLLQSPQAHSTPAPESLLDSSPTESKPCPAKDNRPNHPVSPTVVQMMKW